MKTLTPSRLSDKLASRNGPRHSVYWVQPVRSGSAMATRGSISTGPTGDMGAKAEKVEYSVRGKYTGEWQDGKKHGYGVFVYANGSKYEGEWFHDLRHGKGTCWVRDKTPGAKKGLLRKQYAGDWEDDMRHGLGTLFREDGGRYEGEWVRNKRAGDGKMVYGGDAPSVYDGQWLNNERSGHGVLVLANGDRYDGHWLNDKKEGPGRFHYRATGKIYEGEWVEDAPKCGTYRDDDGSEAEFGQKDQFPLPELGLAHPERVVSESIAYIRQERLMEKAFQAHQLSDEDAMEDFSRAMQDHEPEDQEQAGVVFDAETMRLLQHEFQQLERSDGTIQCHTLPHMLQSLGLDLAPEQIDVFLDEIGATGESAISFAECVDIVSLLMESALESNTLHEENGDEEDEEEDE
ncbi:hypothetical protein Poli38472_001087 [Pythium oligandrum]|uniref:MORN repeat-containing protein 3 n=1 Tax=Pythium oligandrum TaxID=41045 RepID=A0A8K1CSB4_PYTOL|nr:hypothetical protein Poli38472_001087 [Pythium oligandrum]|eukprot:TMW68931.1 hypothetical protein Poli38472_001087 [Pythium oligandrum]